MQTQKHKVLGKPIGINQACAHIASQSGCTPGLKIEEISCEDNDLARGQYSNTYF